ncbi:hypothetical protein AB0J63_49445, partial [Streptosporangium canum]|uniref:hypothetical protein n=1 Tax=Streptosporangium canum TaxID=324952 RepID=UPI00341B1D76
MLLARHPLYVAVAAAVSAVTALPAVASASAANTARDASPVCIDATNERADNTGVRLWQCMDHANQRFVFDGSQIKVKDTIGTS